MNGQLLNPTDPFIRMEDVALRSVRNPGRVVAEGVNWTVLPGEYWVIAGLQGAGKTDFLLTAAGVMGPLRGRYSLFGEVMPIFDEARLPTRLRLGLVFDGGQLLTHLTVWENIALPLRYHENLTLPEANDRVEEAVAALELKPWMDSTPGMLSRSWRKRVGLARALMLKPQLLLLDDPLAGLDLRHVQWWMDFLDSLVRGGAWPGNGPVTLVVTSSELLPWKGHVSHCAFIENRSFRALGSWEHLATERDPLLCELLAQPTLKTDETSSPPE